MSKRFKLVHVEDLFSHIKPHAFPQSISAEDMPVCAKEWVLSGLEVEEDWLEPEARTHLADYAEAIISINHPPPAEEAELGVVNINLAQYGLVDGEWRLL